MPRLANAPFPIRRSFLAVNFRRLVLSPLVAMKVPFFDPHLVDYGIRSVPAMDG